MARIYADITTTVSGTTTATEILTTTTTAITTWIEFLTTTSTTTTTKPTTVSVSKTVTTTVTIVPPCPPPVITTETTTETTTAKTTTTKTATSTATIITTTTDIDTSTVTTTRTSTSVSISTLTPSPVITTTTVTKAVTTTITGSLPTATGCKGTCSISLVPKTTQTLHFDDLTAVSTAGPLPSIYRGLSFHSSFQIIKGGALPLGLPPSSPNAIFFNPHLSNPVPGATSGDGKKFGLLSFRIAGCFSYSGSGGGIDQATASECMLRLEGYGQGKVAIFTTTITRDKYTTFLMPPTDGFGEGLLGLRWSVYLQTGEKIEYGQFFALDNIVLANEDNGVYFCVPQ
ncbi:hypothetical protein BZA05DRAFT_476997 [Tricharina praecox]|uniref:uncharacterized protein n=1 Tax=Tricharina praecox TaxID=43433 RepID=UPI002220D6D0|nr:uncharacterized protein BZA05DRAFT_476997 [Tricharina praecox]KAI5844144.1 hypothetical protein BZA05DRAFT_476997 [Tricharina praecox]